MYNSLLVFALLLKYIDTDSQQITSIVVYDPTNIANGVFNGNMQHFDEGPQKHNMLFHIIAFISNIIIGKIIHHF